MRHLVAQLREAAKRQDLVNPDRIWVEENKRKMLGQIQNIVNSDTASEKNNASQVGMWYRIFVPQTLIYSMKTAIIVLFGVFLTTGGWIASAYAQPGDVLWNAKSVLNIVIEQGQLALTLEEDEAMLHLSFASKRAMVVKEAIDDAPDPVKKADIARKNMDDIKKNLELANERLKNTSPGNTKDLVKEVKDATAEISTVLTESAEKVVLEDKELAKDLDEGAAGTKKKALEMVEVVVGKKAEAKEEVSDEERQILEETIEEFIGDTQKGIEKARGLVVEIGNKQIQIQEDSIAEGNSVVIASSTEEIVSSSSKLDDSFLTSTLHTVLGSNDNQVTNVVNSKETISKEGVEEVSQKVERTVQTLEEGVKETQELVKSDMLGAIKKVRELSNQIDQTVQDVKGVSDALPDIRNTGEVEILEEKTVSQ